MTFIHDFAELLNTELKANLCEKDVEAFGIVQLLDRDGKRFPAELCDDRGTPTVFDDKRALRLYHRLGRDIQREDTGEGFGDQRSYRYTATMRLVGVAANRRLDTQCKEKLGAIAMQVDSALPRSKVFEATGANRISVLFGSIGMNLDTILEEEFRGYDKNKLNPLAVSAFVIEYNLTWFSCAGVCDISALVAV